MEEQIIEKKKSKAPLVILLLLLFLIAVAGSSFGGYIFGKADADKIVKEKTECEKQLKEAKVDKEEVKEKTECEKEKPKCYGTYYVNGDANQGKYILKEDGTYQVEGIEESGKFVINSNTITFIDMKHTVGPKDQDPVYNDGKSYLISEDCSTITLTSSGSHTSAELKKAN